MDSFGKNTRIIRIQEMEQIFTAAKNAFDEGIFRPEEDAEQGEMLRILTEYYESPLWKDDYAADERGELPGNLLRGVLSEDGLYNLLTDIAEESV